MIATHPLKAFVVVDEEDRPDRSAFTLALNDLAAGRVAAEVRPGTRRRIWVGRSLLEAMGKDARATGSGRQDARTWDWLSAWLSGERVEHIIVNRAHLLGANEWRDLLELTATTSTQLWFVVQQPVLSRSVGEVLNEWPHEQLTWPEYTDRWGQHAIDVEPRAAISDSGALSVPRADFLTFLATAERVLLHSDYLKAEAAFVSAGRATLAWLEAGGKSTEWPGRVRRSLSTAETRDEAVARLRGIQMALFLRGLSLRVNLSAFRRGARQAGLTSIDAEIAERLRQYAHPSIAAAAVIRLATGASLSELVALRLRDVAAHGDCVNFGDREARIPTIVAGVVRAAQEQRTWDGACGDDPLLVPYRLGPESPVAFDEHALQQVMKKTSAEIGVQLLTSLEHWNADDARWARSLGMSLGTLGGASE